MTSDDETRARHFAEVLLALRIADEHGIDGPTIADLSPYYPTGLPRGPRSIAATMRELTDREFAFSQRRFALTVRDRLTADGKPIPKWIRQGLNGPGRYWLTTSGRIAADMIRLASGHWVGLDLKGDR